MALINPAILMDPPCEPGCPRKRRRLDNLTPEERALRRKLKNRVAAQTARDRKKARMSELEESLAIFEEQNKKLQMENKNLQRRLTELEDDNAELKSRLGLISPPCSPSLNDEVPSLPSPPNSPPQSEDRVVIKQEKESNEYAELKVSQPKEQSPILFLSLLTTTVLLSLLSLMSYSAFLRTLSQGIQTNSLQSKKNQTKYLMSVAEEKNVSAMTEDATAVEQGKPMEWGKEQKAWNPIANS